MIKDTSGPAFPQTLKNGPGDQSISYYGMTLRDYFAAKVLQGQLAADWNVSKEQFAEWSYKMADAMLEARK